MDKLLLISIILTFSAFTIRAQEEVILELDSKKLSESEIYINVDQKPEFPNGKVGLTEFYKNTSTVLICEKKEDACKTLYYQVVIDTLGNVGSFKIIKGVNEKLDYETELIINKMPKWTPGKKDGKLVKVLVTLDIKFKITD